MLVMVVCRLRRRLQKNRVSRLIQPIGGLSGVGVVSTPSLAQTTPPRHGHQNDYSASTLPIPPLCIPPKGGYNTAGMADRLQNLAFLFLEIGRKQGVLAGIRNSKNQNWIPGFLKKK